MYFMLICDLRECLYDVFITVEMLASGLVHSAAVLHREGECLDECLREISLVHWLMHYVPH